MGSVDEILRLRMRPGPPASKPHSSHAGMRSGRSVSAYGCALGLGVNSETALTVIFLVALSACVVGARAVAWSRRRDYQSGSWHKVARALRNDVRFGGASARLDALASAGVGDFASARRLLLRPTLGQFEEERELALCTKVVIASFEGRAQVALGLCRQLVDLPFEPRDDQKLRRSARRAGVVALARTLAGIADEMDYEQLCLAATLEPTLFWPCHYGAAVSCCARDESELACSLLSRAPHWPSESVFSSLHGRIVRSARATVDMPRRAGAVS